MISPSTDKHQKHAKLAHASYGEWGRNELAIMGTDCASIRQLAQAIIQFLPEYKIAFADADHGSAATEQQNISAGNKGTYIEYTNKLTFTRLDIEAQPDPFYKRSLFNDCDLILVNGNHFTASKQIVVIDEKKSIEKKLDQLTDVRLILLKDSTLPIPDYLKNTVPDSSFIGLFDNKETILRHIKHYMLQQLPSVNGLVLSGGHSTRMGKDKGELYYHGATQREHLYNLLKDICAEVYVSCNEEQAKHIPHLPLVTDTFLGLGPLGGILSAFQQNPDAAWLTVACDLPFLQKRDLLYLLQSRNESKMATALRDAEGKFPEPLVTVWEPKAYPHLLRFLAQGYSCPRKILINSDVEILQPPDSSAFRNINTKEEYSEALCQIHKQV